MKYGAAKQEQPDCTLKIAATVADNRLSVRNAGAEAVLPDGTKMEICTFFGSPGIVVTLRAPDGSWRDYSFGAQEIGMAVMEAEKEHG